MDDGSKGKGKFMDIQENIRSLVIEIHTFDDDTKKELESIAGDENEIKERFLCGP